MMNITDRQRLIQKLNKFEIQCVTGNFIDDDFDIDLTGCLSSKEYELIQDLNNLMKSIMKHDYKEAVEYDYSCLRPFQEVCKNLTLVFYEARSEVKSNYQYLFHPKEKDCPYMKQLILLLVAVAALQEFVRANMCGPLSGDAYNIYLLPDTHFSDASIIDALERDGEAILTNVAHPKLLYLSLMLLFGNNFDKCLTHKWWLIRCMMVHQKILPCPIISHNQSLTSLIRSQEGMSFLNNKEPLAQIMFYTECAQTYMYYHELNVAERFLVSAQNVLGIGIEFKIAFKKHFSKMPQSGFVKVKRNDARYRSIVQDYKLSDDFSISGWETYIDLVDSDGNKIKELLPEEQIVLLAYCDLLGNWEKEFVTQEEDRPLLNCLLSQRKNWSLQIKALILKCKKENSGKRRIIKQLISLVEQKDPNFTFRQNMLYCVSLPMRWELQKIYADVLLESGFVDHALKIYENYHLWEGAIVCYKKRTDLVQRGTRRLEAQIAIKPSSLLWCYLGDLTDNPDMYLVAWNLSRHTNARSKRSLGFYYYKESRYLESRKHFQKSIELNYLQPKVLLFMGRVAMSCEEYGIAVKMFTQMLAMDSNNFEAWNCLTTAYINMGQLKDAGRSLAESQAFGLEHETFENSILISAKIGAFSGTIRLYRKFLADLEHRDSLCFTDFNLEALRIVTDAVLKRIPDRDLVPSFLLKKELLHLFKKIISLKAENPTVLEMYTSLLNAGWDKPDSTTYKKILLFQKKIINLHLANRKDTNQHIELVLQCVLKFAQLSLAYLRELNPRFSTLKKREMAHSKLFLSETVDKVEKLQQRLHFSTKAQGLLSVIKQDLRRNFQLKPQPSHIFY